MTDWPQAGGNAQRTGYSPDTLGALVAPTWRTVFTPTERTDPQAQAIIVTTSAVARVFLGTMGVGANASKFYALAATASSSTPLWTATLDAPVRRAAASDGTRVTVVTQAGTVYCFNCVDGSNAWSPTTFSLPGQCQAAPLYADGLFVYVDSSGRVTALQPTTGTVGSLGWTYQVSVTAGGHSFGVPLLMTPAFYDGGSSATRWAIIPRMDLHVEAVYTSGASKGTRAWITTTPLMGTALKDYWPVVSGGRVLIRPLHKYGEVDGTVWPNVTPVNRSVTPANLSDARSGATSNYQHTLYSLSATTGAWTTADALPHYNVGILMHGTNPPVAIDGDGLGIISAPVGSDYGYARLNLATGDLTNLTTTGYSNLDEITAVSCANRDIIVVHRQGRGQAQRHAIISLTTGVWRNLGDGPLNSTFIANMEHGGTNPAAVFGTRLYQNAEHQLICYST